MDLNETYDIEAEIEAELAKIGDDEIQLSDNEDEAEFTRLSDIVTEGWSSEGQVDSSPEKSKGGNEACGQSSEEEDGASIWNRLCASDQLASQLRADLEDCSKLLLDAEERIQSLDEAEYSIEITEMAKKQGKTPEDLKKEIIQDLEKLEQDLEDELSKSDGTGPADSSKPESDEHLELVKLDQKGTEDSGRDDYFEKDSLVLVPSKQRNRLNTSSGISMPGTPGGLESLLGSVRTPTGGSGRPDTIMSTGRMTSLAAEWDQYLTEIEQELEQSASQLEAVDVEKEAFRRLLELHQSQKKSDHVRAARFLKHKDRLKQMTEESQKKREQEKNALESVKNKLDQAKKELLTSVEQEEKHVKDKMNELEQQHNAYMQEKVEMLERERKELLNRQKEIETETKAKHNSAALRIQKCYRGMLSRQKYSLLIKLRKKRMVEWRAMREADAIAEIALKNREKSKVDEEKRAKEAAAKAEKVKRENEEANQKIKKAEEEKRKERAEKRRQENAAKAKDLGTKEEVEKLELEQQAIEVIEKLRSEEKSKVEKKVDKLNEQKKQNKGKKRKGKLDLTSTNAERVEEVNHDNDTLTAEASEKKDSISNDLADIPEDVNEDLVGEVSEGSSEKKSSNQKITDDPNGVEKDDQNLEVKAYTEPKTDKIGISDEQSDVVSGLSEQIERTSFPDENVSTEKVSVIEKEKTLFDFNAELNNLIETEPEKSAVKTKSSYSDLRKAINENKSSIECDRININHSENDVQNKTQSASSAGAILEDCTNKSITQSELRTIDSSPGIKDASINETLAVIIGVTGNQIGANKAILGIEVIDKKESYQKKIDLTVTNETLNLRSEVADLSSTEVKNGEKSNRSSEVLNQKILNSSLDVRNEVEVIGETETLPINEGKFTQNGNTKRLSIDESGSVTEYAEQVNNRESIDVYVEKITNEVALVSSNGGENQVKMSDKTRPQSSQNNTDYSSMTKKNSEDVKIATVELSAVLEQRRIQWMSDCIPWTKIKTVQKQAQNGAKPRMPMRSAASRKLKSISQDLILTGCLGRATALMNVQTVVLSDLPGYNLEPFNNCVNLESLVLDSCNILSLEGLSNCNRLKMLHAKHNQLESLYLGQLENLIELDVSSNRVSSLAGLDGCSNLRILNLMDNKVSRLGSLAGLKRLQQLNMSANQLISTRGLSLVSSLTTLDVSANHITALEEIESLALLQVLIASGNTIQEMPRLTNNVLLRYVDMGSNCISSAATLSICWLPLLRTLNLSRNSLDSLPSLKATMNLEVLDCSSNQINTAESLIESLGSLDRLRVLNAKDNPLLVDTDPLSTIRCKFPSLIQFNDEEIRRDSTIKAPGTKTPHFQSVCLSQLELLESMESAIKLLKPDTVTETTSVLEYIATKTALLDLHFEMSVKLREEHEYGETHVVQTFVSVDTLINQHRVKLEAVHQVTAEDKKEQFARPPSRPKSAANARPKTGEGSNFARRSEEGQESSRRIQEIKVPTVASETVEFVRNAWKSAVRDSNEQAATRIQATWRGYSVRKKLSSIQAQVDAEIKQMMLEEDLELDEEIDLDQFNYLDTDFSLDDWTLDQDHDALPGYDKKTTTNWRDSSKSTKWLDISSIASQPLPTVLETEREKLKASISVELPLGNPHFDPRTSEGIGNERLHYHGPTNDDAVSKIDLYDEVEEEANANSFSARQTKIAQDWGFKSSATAELMLKRAKKMSKVKKHIVTDIPQHSRMQTKGSHSVHSSNNSSTVNSRTSSRMPNGPESLTSSRRSHHTNVLQPKVFDAGDFTSNAPSTDNYSRVFAWVNLGGSDNGPERDGGHGGAVVAGSTGEHPTHSNRDSPLLRTGSPKPMGNPITPTTKRNSLNNVHQNVRHNDNEGGDIDILSVSDTRSQRSSQRVYRQQRSGGSPDSKRTDNSSSISSFLNKTKILPPINGKYVDCGSERTSSGGWGAGKKRGGKPPKPSRTNAK